MTIKRSQVTRAASVTACLALLSGVGACGTENESAAIQASGASQSAPLAPTSDSETPAPLAPDTIGAARHDGTDFEAVAVAEAQPAISQQRAIELANAEFRYKERRPDEMSLGRVTIHTINKRITTGDPANPRKEPLYVDTLVWALVYNDIRTFISGPAQAGEQEGPSDYIAPLIALFDATTGKFMFADTFSREDAKKPPYENRQPLEDLGTEVKPRRTSSPGE